MKADDRDVSRFLRLFTLLERSEIEALEAAGAANPEQRAPQRALASDVTRRVHGDEALRAAEQVSVLLFGGGDPAALTAGALHALAAEIPSSRIEAGDALDTEHVIEALTTALGPMPIVAENLGLITPDVEALRERFGYPGMAILQFAFDGQASEFIPPRYVPERVVYTGTHDNDTTMGWWTSTGEGDSTRAPEAVANEKAFAKRYLATDGQEMHWVLIRTALASVANTVLIPMQDVLGLGSEARMNLPGRQSGNWGFRFTWEQLTPDLTERLHALTTTYER
jgi:hypothetical protein